MKPNDVLDIIYQALRNARGDARINDVTIEAEPTEDEEPDPAEVSRMIVLAVDTGAAKQLWAIDSSSLRFLDFDDEEEVEDDDPTLEEDDGTIIRVTSSPWPEDYEEEEDAPPWDYSKPAFQGWVWEVFQECDEDAEKLERKLRQNDFTLEDFRDQLRTIRKMGPLESILGMLPGMGNLKQLADNKPDEKQLNRIEAIIGSMTPQERRRHDLINGSRRKRIAKGSGTSVEEVNRLLKQFVQMKKMLKQLGALQGGGGRRGGMLGMLRGRR